VERSSFEWLLLAQRDWYVNRILLSRLSHTYTGFKGNIATHFYGALSVLYLILAVYPRSPPALSPFPVDSIVLLAFLFCALKCLIFSTLWHLLAGCATIHVFRRSACLDYVGISALISSSILTMVHYAFYCRPDLSVLYCSVVGLLGLVGMVIPFVEWFDKRENKAYRVLFFLCMCASAFVPMSHAALLYGVKEAVVFFSQYSLLHRVLSWSSKEFY
jgi:adiponectin receptor